MTRLLVGGSRECDPAGPPLRDDRNGREGTRKFVDSVLELLQACAVNGWTTFEDEFWCFVEPPDYHERRQGWKLHVSATPLSAHEVLGRACKVLFDHKCAFKFARTLDRVEELVSANCERTGAGKFITTYPDNDEHFRRIAEDLHRATAGLSGPQILSDRPYRSGSLVHYRYGAFANPSVLTNDGYYESMLLAPDGTLIKDEQGICSNPPPWVSMPLADIQLAQPVTSRPKPVLLGDRFLVQRAIRRSNRGGVYRALDQLTGRPVIIKQSRAHVGSTLNGSDLRDALRHEAQMLEHFGPSLIAPIKVALFDQETDVFLAEELIEGNTLRNWVTKRIDGPYGLALADGISTITKVINLIAVAHDAGYVCRDINPDNIMVDHDGQLRLVDLELLAHPGEWVVNAFTLGYGAPEQISAPEWGPAPALTADLFSVGATAFFTLTGIDPILMPDRITCRPMQDRIAAWFALISGENGTARRLAPLVLGLMHDDASLRWGLDRSRKFFNALQFEPNRFSPEALPSHDVPSAEELLELLIDGLDHLLGTMAFNPDRSFWPCSPQGSYISSDPYNVQHGAAGVLAVLTRASEVLQNDALTNTLRIIAIWIDQHWPAEQKVLPGLYFGRSGTAWALFDAARSFGDEKLMARAVYLAKRVPITWPNPDICHGAAGAGMTQLHMWQVTGDAAFLDRVQRCADGLVLASEHRTTGVVWPIPATFESALAGLVHYGFAHGVAGVASFLLAAGITLGRIDYVEIARSAGATLRAVADIRNGAAWWPSGEGDTSESHRLTHWCSGSSGVGTFLVRLWLATGDTRFRDLAEMAAVAVRHNKWHSLPVACHGLAGDGEFLLDLFDCSGDPRYRQWAEELAACIFVQSAKWDGRLVVPDESGLSVAVDYGTGLAGVLSFLLRLCYGGPRFWMADWWNNSGNELHRKG